MTAPLSSASAFTLRAVPGFFVQGDAGTADPPAHAPRLGLLPRRSWRDVNAVCADGTHKLVVFLRHGQGTHNAGKARVGEAAWLTHEQFHERYFDAPLTEAGMKESEAAGTAMEEQVTEGHAVDLIVVSPLERTLQTFAIAYARMHPAVPAIAMELARETLGTCMCDRRKPTAPKRAAFPTVDFGGVTDEEDTLWLPDERESDEEIEARARLFLSEIFHARPEHRIAVVSHTGFIRACLRALGHRLYRPANAEYVPVLIQDSSVVS